MRCWWGRLWKGVLIPDECSMMVTSNSGKQREGRTGMMCLLCILFFQTVGDMTGYSLYKRLVINISLFPLLYCIFLLSTYLLSLLDILFTHMPLGYLVRFFLPLYFLLLRHKGRERLPQREPRQSTSIQWLLPICLLREIKRLNSLLCSLNAYCIIVPYIQPEQSIKSDVELVSVCLSAELPTGVHYTPPLVRTASSPKISLPGKMIRYCNLLWWTEKKREDEGTWNDSVWDGWCDAWYGVVWCSVV